MVNVTMRIALYISPVFKVPPATKHILAPWHLVQIIADGLIEKGHEVTVFAASGSSTLAKLVDGGIAPYDEMRKELSDKDFVQLTIFNEQLLASKMYTLAAEGKFDIINIHHPVNRLLPLASLCKTPTLFTLHDPISDHAQEQYLAYKHHHQISYISISAAQRGGRPLPFAGTVHNGIDLSLYPFEEHVGNYLLIVGRIREEKGVHVAIEVAKKMHTPLTISGEHFPQYPDLYAYWRDKIEPTIGKNHIRYFSLLAPEKLVGLYKNAKAFLFPILWEEPFGLVMIESMACGTPVVAYNRGSVPEVVKDGVTGFIIDPDDSDRPGKGSYVIKKKGLEGLTEAISKIGEISRSVCRKHVEEHFSVEKMVEGYERIYKSTSNKKR